MHGAAWKALGRRRRWLVLGRQPPRALGFTVNLVHLWPMQGAHQRVSEEESLQGTPRALWVLCINPCLPPAPTDSAHLASSRDAALCGAAMSVTLFVNTHEART